MAHFAHVNKGIVDSVIVIEQNVLDESNGWHCPSCGEHKNVSEWVQTSYNTHGGVHKLGDIPLRKNFAGVGYTYDEVRDAFIPPQPFESWTLDEVKCQWKAPKALPKTNLEANFIEWNEEALDWKIIPRTEVISEKI